MNALARLIRGIFTGRAEPLDWRAEMATTNQSAAAAKAAESKISPLELSATVGSKRIHLQQVPLDGSPRPAPVRGTTFCLDIHENENALVNAVEYVRQAHTTQPGGVIRFTPSIFALVNTPALSQDQLGLVNNKLIPAGAAIFEYPKACKSFKEAMRALFKEIVESRRAYAESRGERRSFTGLAREVGQGVAGAATTGSSAKAVGRAGTSGSLKASMP